MSTGTSPSYAISASPSFGQAISETDMDDMTVDTKLLASFDGESGTGEMGGQAETSRGLQMNGSGMMHHNNHDPPVPPGTVPQTHRSPYPISDYTSSSAHILAMIDGSAFPPFPTIRRQDTARSTETAVYRPTGVESDSFDVVPADIPLPISPELRRAVPGEGTYFDVGRVRSELVMPMPDIDNLGVHNVEKSGSGVYDDGFGVYSPPRLVRGRRQSRRGRQWATLLLLPLAIILYSAVNNDDLYYNGLNNILQSVPGCMLPRVSTVNLYNSVVHRGRQAIRASLSVTGGLGIRSQPPVYDTEAIAGMLNDQMIAIQGVYYSASNLFHQSPKSASSRHDLHYKEMWQYAVAIRAKSNLPERIRLASDLVKLGDLTSQLAEEAALFTAFYHSKFSSIASEFDHLGRSLLLSARQLSADFYPSNIHERSPVDLARALNTSMGIVRQRLDDIQVAAEKALEPAQAARYLGMKLLDDISADEERLNTELRARPAWHDWGHVLKETLIGVTEPSLREIIANDQALSAATIGVLVEMTKTLEETRSRLIVQKKSVQALSAASIRFLLLDVAVDGGQGDAPRRQMLGHTGEKNHLIRVVEEFRGVLQMNVRQVGSGSGRGGYGGLPEGRGGGYLD